LPDLTVVDGVAWLTLNRPAVLNALDLASVRALAAMLAELRIRDDVRVVVTRGEGRAYCAGSDLRDLAARSPADAVAAEQEQADACGLLEALPQPTVAALHGSTLGGGLGFAAYHDLRVAAASTAFGMPEVPLGWTPPWAIGRLVDLVGGARARWLLLSGTRVSAAEALAWGLVDQVVPDDELIQTVEALAHRLAAMPPAGLRETKRLLQRLSPYWSPLWDERAAAAFARCYRTPEAQANVTAFLARHQKS
jgi:enoyl-CoA hydratase/carnithine racemase